MQGAVALQAAERWIAAAGPSRLGDALGALAVMTFLSMVSWGGGGCCGPGSTGRSGWPQSGLLCS